MSVKLEGQKKRKAHELVGFLAIWAVQYQKDYQLDGLHPGHYDLMLKYGARMDSFKRSTNASQTPLPDHQSDTASHDNGSSPQI